MTGDAVTYLGTSAVLLGALAWDWRDPLQGPPSGGRETVVITHVTTDTGTFPLADQRADFQIAQMPLDSPGVATTALKQLFTYEDTYVSPKTELGVFPELGNDPEQMRSVLMVAKETHQFCTLRRGESWESQELNGGNLDVSVCASP